MSNDHLVHDSYIFPALFCFRQSTSITYAPGRLVVKSTSQMLSLKLLMCKQQKKCCYLRYQWYKASKPKERYKTHEDKQWNNKENYCKIGSTDNVRKLMLSSILSHIIGYFFHYYRCRTPKCPYPKNFIGLTLSCKQSLNSIRSFITQGHFRGRCISKPSLHHLAGILAYPLHNELETPLRIAHAS